MKQYHETCCVPQCTASSKYNGLLSFHGFPSDPDLRRQWLANIRRDKLKLTQHTKVCSLHFTPDQLLQPKAAGGRRVVSRGAVPVLFSWSHRSVQPPRAGLRSRMEKNHLFDLKWLLFCLSLEELKQMTS
uniref:THAP domain-containing protein 1 n=1 Tax=Xiphophorus maculatus TaxID=8083 RepID=A0A3B5R6L7_XIPMA